MMSAIWKVGLSIFIFQVLAGPAYSQGEISKTYEEFERATVLVQVLRNPDFQLEFSVSDEQKKELKSFEQTCFAGLLKHHSLFYRSRSLTEGEKKRVRDSIETLEERTQEVLLEKQYKRITQLVNQISVQVEVPTSGLLAKGYKESFGIDQSTEAKILKVGEKIEKELIDLHKKHQKEMLELLERRDEKLLELLDQSQSRGFRTTFGRPHVAPIEFYLMRRVWEAKKRMKEMENRPIKNDFRKPNDKSKR